MTTPFFFNKPFRLSAEEKVLFLASADKATASLKRNQKWDGVLSPISGFRLLGGLATYAFLLRHIASGRRVRYFAPFRPAGCMAAFLGHAEVLRVFERHGVPLESLTWSWRKPNPLDFAVMGRNYSLVKELLAHHPGLAQKEEWRQDAVAYCAQYGTIPILRLLRKAGLSLSRLYWSGPEGSKWRSKDGTPFFLAVAANRREIVRELIRLGEFHTPEHTGGTSAAHLDASLLSLAVQHHDFELADWLVERGWTHEDMFDLPNDSFAWEDLESFRYLCRKFPDEDFKADIRAGGDSLHLVSKEVLSFAWDGHVPDSVMEAWRKAHEWDLEWHPGDPFPDDDQHLAADLGKYPDEVLRLEKEQPGRFLRLLTEQLSCHVLSSSLVYILRLARAKGVVLFRDKAEKAAFLDSLCHCGLEALRPHLSEFGLPPVSNAEMARRYRKEWGHLRRRTENLRVRRLASTPSDELRLVLDNPDLDPNVEITPNWPFALEVALHATPRAFDAWVLRGMDPYAHNCEGITTMEIGNVKLLRHLIHAFGMSPDHVSYDGTMPLGNALSTQDMAKARVLVEEGADINSWNKRGSSWLHRAILESRDEFARFLLRHGAVNRDCTGRVQPVEPWMIGGAQPLKTRRL